MSQRQLVLKNSIGEATRYMPWPEGEKAFVIFRWDRRRVDVISDLEVMEQNNIQYELIREITPQDLEKGAVALGTENSLEMVSEIGTFMRNNPEVVEVSNSSKLSGTVSGAFLVIFFALFAFQPEVMVSPIEEILEPEMVVKIAPQTPPPPRQVELVNRPTTTRNTAPTQTTSSKTVSRNVNRMGALSVLGTRSSGSQQGGVNLGSAQTTRGAGLGGTGGSGGAQKSLYGKGLVNAPVGEGNNMQGGGGYGTKGRGGGQDGYGQLSLTGSVGGNPIPLGREAIVRGGLDRALIADVVERNKGQVRFCYEQELQSDPRLAGRVVVAWLIGSDGTVSNARIQSSTLHSRNVEECILTRLRTWRFPLPEGEGNVDVNFPFLLEKRS